MNTIKNTPPKSKLYQSKEYRETFVSAFLKRHIPFQIRTIRKNRGMSQLELATQSKITQGVISRAEDPDNGNLAFNTVLRIAAGFDLAFVGKFVRFSEFLKVVDEMSEDSLHLPGFVEECRQEQIRAEERLKLPAAADAKDVTSQPLLEEAQTPNKLFEMKKRSPQPEQLNTQQTPSPLAGLGGMR